MKSQYGEWIVLILFLMPIMSSLFYNSKSSQKIKAKNTTTFKFPAIPLGIDHPEQRTDFLMEHYWDNFDFKDTANIEGSLMAERAFADFIHLLTFLSTKKATRVFRQRFDRVEYIIPNCLKPGSMVTINKFGSTIRSCTT